MAERYFAEYPDPEFILGKPFTDERDFPLHLFELGVLFHFLRVTPDDVVLEFGAGTCWVSHFLNRFGCKTISVDVSATALRLGRTLFERDSKTRWEVEPEFLVYDGHRLPLAVGRAATGSWSTTPSTTCPTRRRSSARWRAC